MSGGGEASVGRLSGPGTIRTTAKPARAYSMLRDINRCAVRPGHLIAHQGYSVLVTDVRGDISGAGIEGFYLHQTRFLSSFKLDMDGEAFKPVSATSVDHHLITAYHLGSTPDGAIAGPKQDRADPEPGEVATKAIEVQVNLFVGDGLHADLIATNHAFLACDVTFILHLAADFADFNECLAGRRQQRALVERAFKADGDRAGTLDFVYRHAQLDLGVAMTLDGADAITDLGHAVAITLRLAPQTPRVVTFDLAPWFEGRRFEPLYGLDGTFSAESPPATARRAWMKDCTTMAFENAVVQQAWDQAVSDLASLQVLEGPSSEPFMITAGIPNYTGLFGRDALLTGLQTLDLNPDTLRGVLEVVSRYNAEATDDEFDAEPGKVLHQRQLGPLAKLGITPFNHYYGDASTPGLFLLAAAADLARTGDESFFLSLQPKLMGTVEWMRRNADTLGLHPYQTRSEKGVKNQSWKDSGEAVLYPDGKDVDDPIAMADIQALYYAGQQALGLAFVSIGQDDIGRALLDQAEELKSRFNRYYWMEDERFFALALDADHQQVKTIASDPGTCLAYGIIDEDKAGAVAERLMAEDMFSGWGIRTLSSRHPAYNPFAYHLGTVWPSPNAVTAAGLARYGFTDELLRLSEALFAASQIFTLDRLPEVFGGHPRDARHPHPGLYPGACSPQAWSAGAVIQLVGAMLGLMPLASKNVLVVDPVLPPWLPEVTARRVRVGDRRADLRFSRGTGGRIEVDVLDAGGIHIVVPDLSDLKRGQDRFVARFSAGLTASSRSTSDRSSGHG